LEALSTLASKPEQRRDLRKQQHPSISTKSPAIGVLYMEIPQVNRPAQVTQTGSSALHKSRQRTSFSRPIANLDSTSPVDLTLHPFYLAAEDPRERASTV
jgi:hypothetical protein